MFRAAADATAAAAIEAIWPQVIIRNTSQPRTVKGLLYSHYNVSLKLGIPRPLYCLFSFFSNTKFTEKTVGVSGVQTRIVGVEGEHVNDLASKFFF